MERRAEVEVAALEQGVQDFVSARHSSLIMRWLIKVVTDYQLEKSPKPPPAFAFLRTGSSV